MINMYTYIHDIEPGSKIYSLWSITFIVQLISSVSGLCFTDEMEWRTVVITVLVVSLCFLAIPIRVGPDRSLEDAQLFETYVIRYNKTYRRDPTQYNERFQCFQSSLRHIERMNGLRSSQESAYYGLTEYSDMSEDEFLAKALRSDLSRRGERHTTAPYHRAHRSHEGDRRKKRVTSIPLKLDWRTKKVITPVRSQGACGACWAFSTIEVIESMFAIRNGSLYPLSVQEMIDCATNSNLGCEGGDICSLLTWLLSSKASIVPESSYPLTWKTDTCKLSKIVSKTPGVRVKDFTCDRRDYLDVVFYAYNKQLTRPIAILIKTDHYKEISRIFLKSAEDELLSLLATHGPVAAAVNALPWQNYLGGVIQFHCTGSFTSLNHAVEIVGYDRSASIPHYIIKNSWGTMFGDEGYIYIAIGSNLCGIANQVSSVDIL